MSNLTYGFWPARQRQYREALGMRRSWSRGRRTGRRDHRKRPADRRATAEAFGVPPELVLPIPEELSSES